jgi:hypothetical protein
MRAALVVLGVVSCGCESVGDVVKEQKPGVEKTFAALHALSDKVALAPPLEKAELTKPAVPIALDGEGFNAMFVYAEDLATPGKAADVALRTLDSLPLLQCGSLLETQHLFNDTVTRVSPSVAKGTLEACARLRYALVIRLQEYVRPMLSLETKQFAPGKYRADVLVFDLSNGAVLGGFPVVATNNSRVSLLDGDANHVQRLIANLESSTFDALRAGAASTLSDSAR